MMYVSIPVLKRPFARGIAALGRRSLSYDATIGNLDINKETRVIFQVAGTNITQASLAEQYEYPSSRKAEINKLQATQNAKDTIAYGTNIVGGVSPGKGGTQHLGLPVFDSVRKAMHGVKPDASTVFVPAPFAAAAIIEAIEAEIPLVVSVAEHIPVQDMLRVHEVLQTQSMTRLVGPNCPGIIAPGQCRLGIMPYQQYSPGVVGIVSKSGTLSYEAVGATSGVGLGQSLVVGMGGDMLAGTTLVDGLKLFFDHPATKGIIVIGEIGGEAELKAAEAIAKYRKFAKDPKPIIAMVAGRTAPAGKTMGHAGALLSPRDASADAKAKQLEAAGAVLVPHPGLMGSEMKRLLGL